METARRVAPEWDDRLWDQVWERNLTQVERHNTGLAVLRQRQPGSPFEDLVASELAHRWRRRSLVLGAVWAIWTAFWGALVVAPLPDDVDPSPLPRACVVFGVVVIAGCLVARRRFSGYLAMVSGGLAAGGPGRSAVQEPRP